MILKKFQVFHGIGTHDFSNKAVVFVYPVFSGRDTRLKYTNSMVIGIQQKQLNIDMMIDANVEITL